MPMDRWTFTSRIRVQARIRNRTGCRYQTSRSRSMRGSTRPGRLQSTALGPCPLSSRGGEHSSPVAVNLVEKRLCGTRAARVRAGGPFLKLHLLASVRRSFLRKFIFQLLEVKASALLHRREVSKDLCGLCHFLLHKRETPELVGKPAHASRNGDSDPRLVCYFTSDLALLFEHQWRSTNSVDYQIDHHLNTIGNLDEGNATVHAVFLSVKSHRSGNFPVTRALARASQMQRFVLRHSANCE